MTRRYLLFRLYGPLASWGDIAVGELRTSHPWPSRSALLGLLAGALGLRRCDEPRQRSLNDAIWLAVRVDRLGGALRDYHSVQVAKGGGYRTRAEELRGQAEGMKTTQPVNTLLSGRDYRTDASWAVCLWMRQGQEEVAEWSLDRMRNALSQPVFVPYLGRKSCPLAAPVQATIVTAHSVQEAFDTVSFAPLPWDNAVEERAPVYWDADAPADEVGIPAVQQQGQRDLPVSRLRWQFGVRAVHLGYLEAPAAEGGS